jgi:uncharacterized protein (DUF433 family)
MVPEITSADRITVEADKMAGEPCIRGLRITVRRVLDLLAHEVPQDEIIRWYPDLEPEDVRACELLGELANRLRRGRIAARGVAQQV